MYKKCDDGVDDDDDYDDDDYDDNDEFSCTFAGFAFDAGSTCITALMTKDFFSKSIKCIALFKPIMKHLFALEIVMMYA